MLTLRVGILLSNGLLFNFAGLTLVCSGLTASSTGALLTSGKIPSSAGLDIYGFKAIPAEILVATLKDLLGLFYYPVSSLSVC